MYSYTGEIVRDLVITGAYSRKKRPYIHYRYSIILDIRMRRCLAQNVLFFVDNENIIGRAGASPPSRTAAIIFLYIYLYISVSYVVP